MYYLLRVQHLRKMTGKKHERFLVYSGLFLLLGASIFRQPTTLQLLDSSYQTTSTLEPSREVQSDCEQPPVMRQSPDDAFRQGIDPVYLELWEEAKLRSAEDYATSHTLGHRGFAIGPVGGRIQYTVAALKNGVRLKRALHMTNATDNTRVALMTSPEHYDMLQKCTDDSNATDTAVFVKNHAEMCGLWNKGTLFDDVIVTQPGLYQGNENHTRQESGTAYYWLTALSGYRFAPYTQTIFLDSDAYACPGVEALFEIIRPYNKYWQMDKNGQQADFAAGIDQYPFGTGNAREWTPGNPEILRDFSQFSERNTGTVLFHFHRPIAHTFAHFIPLVAEHVYNNVATPTRLVLNDQMPFRIAMYLFKRLHGSDFVDQVLPMHTSCRSYPDKKFAGTDGFINGMYPIQADGTRCNVCRCTPCLINHQQLFKVHLTDDDANNTT